MVDRPARVVAQLYGQAGRSISRPVSANPKGRASLRQGRGDRLGRTKRYALTKTHSGRMLQSDQERL
ncbi:hypothetical protein ELI48_18995 [Rhizobium ruizarguesonis]|nr:hypothetical protein ELI48_18995 [Rhizobium ruizarguesonis]TAU71485.1 hypothetical protein ELI45_19740 [Rhizobium ruizarguesonis]TAV17324.1 hypothetical protein ELI34_18920 [Rhizobium ruizarguesonis]TAV30940.1 hypothetical protein ELI35_20505 [Rhizobium ruizarguesonis]TAW12825.1 hypothetical protein ELI26_19055 [Rhizobium ruizarguesonis]